MELTIEHIRNYDLPRAFSFPDGKLTLLKGISGSGKSSILDAINFALFGKHASQLMTYGYKECSVTLKYRGWTVIRKCGSKKVILIAEDGVGYQGDMAQEMIAKRFGSHFTVVSYLTQKQTKSFLGLGPMERMLFLESIALGEIDIAAIKQKCKDKIATRNKKLNELTGQVQVIRRECAAIVKPEVVLFPLAGGYSKARIDNEREKYRIVEMMMKRCKCDLDGLQDSKAKQVLACTRRSYLLEKLDTIESQIKKCDDILSRKPVYSSIEVKTRITNLRAMAEKRKLEDELSLVKKQYTEQSEIELKRIKSELACLLQIGIVDDESSELLSLLKQQMQCQALQDRGSFIEKRLVIYKSISAYKDRLSNIDKDMQKLQKEYELVNKRAKCYSCPKCHVRLRYSKQGLELAKEDGMQDHQVTMNSTELTAHISALDQTKKNIMMHLDEVRALEKERDDIKSQLANIVVDMTQNYEDKLGEHKALLQAQELRMKKMSQLKAKIENNDISVHKLFKPQISELETRIGKIHIAKDNIALDNIEELEKLYMQTCLDEKEYMSALADKGDNERKKVDINQQILGLGNIDIDYDKLINDKGDELLRLQNKYSRYHDRLDMIKKYLDYIEEQEYYDSWNTKLQNAIDAEKNAVKSLSVIETMLRKIKETESAALMNIIDTINYNLGELLPRLFDDPIDVQIVSFKETAKGVAKASIDIKIMYKGQETVPNNLSGGEWARLELAICLAINEFCGGSMLLLDEVLAHLNEEMVYKISKVLQVEAAEKNKLIILVQHQASCIYDHCIDLDS